MGKELKNLEEAKRAAYALNMCTVSVSQIIDYNDVYILEQEYEAILNNLNLEKIPKDEALLDTLKQLLDTITFFRIQEIKKEQIEKEYQQKVKNAIWSAVPNVSVFITAGASALVQGPLALLSVAATVGSAYMNYRKEKSNALTEKEKAEVELQITAIEQFNALRRELFTTAWRLADTYGFPDEYRLTERQIKQYNEILMDQDEYRKYARLEYIQNKFEAYPPFWYFFGHTAHYIAEQNLPNEQDDERTAKEKALLREEYLRKAKSHLAHFNELNAFSILREDQMATSALLEYVDILMLEEKKDISAINRMITDAAKLAGNSFDLLQMCAVSYLKTGELSLAAPILKMLVNEDYNAVMNAKILSRIYVNGYIQDKDMNAWSDYRILETRIAPEYLFPMPDGSISGNSVEKLEQKFIDTQRKILKSEYEITLFNFIEKMKVRFDKILPLPVSDTEEEPTDVEQRVKSAKKLNDNKVWEPYRRELAATDYRTAYLDVLNDTIAAMEDIAVIEPSNNFGVLIPLNKREEMQKSIKVRIFDKREEMAGYQMQMEKDEGAEAFSLKDYEKMQNTLTYAYFTETFFKDMKEFMANRIDAAGSMSEMEKLENGIVTFCEDYNLPLPETAMREMKTSEELKGKREYISWSVLGSGYKEENERVERIREQLAKIKDVLVDVVGKQENWKAFQVYLRDRDEEAFDKYFANSKLPPKVRQDAVAIFDDNGFGLFEKDLVLCIDRFITTKDKKGIIGEGKYSDVERSTRGKETVLKCDGSEFYFNPNVDNVRLYDLMKKLAE